MARVAHREGYPEIGLYWEKAAYEEAEHAAKFAELLGEVLTDSTKKMCIRDRVVIVGRPTVVRLAGAELAPDANEKGDGMLLGEGVLPLLGGQLGVQVLQLLGGDKGHFTGQLGQDGQLGKHGVRCV